MQHPYKTITPNERYTVSKNNRYIIKRDEKIVEEFELNKGHGLKRMASYFKAKDIKVSQIDFHPSMSNDEKKTILDKLKMAADEIK